LLKTIGIVGSRRRNTGEDKKKVLLKFIELYEDGDHIVSGGCPGCADEFAEQIARQQQIPIMIHYARWNKLGTRAGFIRNTDIAEDADVLIACVAPDRTGGTEDTIAKFLARPAIKEEDLYLV
jgi:hypothetical protein